MYFDRFDIVTAYYFYFIDFHNGQWSIEYQRLCRITGYFNPSPLLNSIEDCNENTIAIYNNIATKTNLEEKDNE
jgi:hypothetical protein